MSTCTSSAEIFTFAEIDAEIGVGVATDGEFPVLTHRFGHAAQEIAEQQIEYPRAAGRRMIW